MDLHEPHTRFDSDQQTLWSAPECPRPAWLVFYRWLAEQGRLEHRTFGPPTGDWATSIRHRTTTSMIAQQEDL
jgi:hypothetical protein